MSTRHIYAEWDFIIWKEICICVERDLHTRKETYIYGKETHICGKRSTNMKRDVYYGKTCAYMKRDLVDVKRHIYVERDLHIWRRVCFHEKRPASKETYIKGKETHVCRKRSTNLKSDLYMYGTRSAYIKRDLGIRKWDPYMRKWDPYMRKEVYLHDKRPVNVWKEICIYEKRPPYMKRDPYMRIEICLHGKRPVYI